MKASGFLYISGSTQAPALHLQIYVHPILAPQSSTTSESYFLPRMPLSNLQHSAEPADELCPHLPFLPNFAQLC